MVCAIVGVGPGVGLAVAKRFAREGFDLALIARRPDALGDYIKELTEAAPALKVRGFPADAGDAATLSTALQNVILELGKVDVLVYNAAVLKPGNPATLVPEEVNQDFAVNVTGALVAAQAVLPAMQAMKSGTILFTGGGLALNPYPMYASLSIGKAGVRSLTFTLADELKPQGIHVATVTIAGFVKPGTRFDPDAIADVYWDLHSQPRENWEREFVFE